jgi:hypothetical protein
VTSPEFFGARQPRIAVTAEGEIFVVFGKENAIYVARSTNGGESFASPVKVGELATLALGKRRGPRIVANGRTVAITAISHGAGDLSSWTSDDAGASWAERARVNDIPRSAREGMQGLAGNGQGKVFAVWLDLRNGGTELWGALSSDGGKTWGPNTRVYQSPDGSICECCHPSVTFSPDGRMIVLWRNSLKGERDMYRAISSDDGKTFGEAEKIGTGSWPLNACPMDGGSLAAGSNKVAYAWRREGKIFWSSEISSETLASNAGTQPVVVPAGSSFHLLWEERGNLMWTHEPNSAPRILAAKAGSADALWSPVHRSVFIVWESMDGKETDLHFERKEIPRASSNQ